MPGGLRLYVSTYNVGTVYQVSGLVQGGLFFYKYYNDFLHNCNQILALPIASKAFIIRNFKLTIFCFSYNDSLRAAH